MWILKYKYIQKFSHLFASVAARVQRNTHTLSLSISSNPNKLAKLI